LDELKKLFPSGALDGKHVKIVSIKGDDGVDIGHDIKHVGSFKATVSLLKDISGEFAISVVALS